MIARSPVAHSVLDRALATIDAVHAADGPTSVGAIAVHTGLPTSTVSRMVAELVEQRYLRRSGSAVVLGTRLFELGMRASMPKRLRAAVAPVMRRISDETGERVVMWVRQDAHMVLVAAVPGRLPAMPTQVGMRASALTTASGKACLAFTAADVVADLSRPLPLRGAARLRDELDEVRVTTIAVDAGVAFPGIHAVASPILSARAEVIGALSLAMPAGAMDAERLAPLLREASASVSQRLTAA